MLYFVKTTPRFKWTPYLTKAIHVIANKPVNENAQVRVWWLVECNEDWADRLEARRYVKRVRPAYGGPFAANHDDPDESSAFDGPGLVAITENGTAWHTVPTGVDDTNDHVCAYCGRYVEDPAYVPAADDDDAWEQLAASHLSWCEWVRTRAHRRWDLTRTQPVASS